MEASHCPLDCPVPEWEEEWVQRSPSCVWDRTACGPGEKKRQERAPPRVQTSESEDGRVKIVVMSRCKRTSSAPDGSQPVSEENTVRDLSNSWTEKGRPSSQVRSTAGGRPPESALEKEHFRVAAV